MQAPGDELGQGISYLNPKGQGQGQLGSNWVEVKSKEVILCIHATGVFKGSTIHMRMEITPKCHIQGVHAIKGSDWGSSMHVLTYCNIIRKLQM